MNYFYPIMYSMQCVNLSFERLHAAVPNIFRKPGHKSLVFKFQPLTSCMTLGDTNLIKSIVLHL